MIVYTIYVKLLEFLRYAKLRLLLQTGYEKTFEIDTASMVSQIWNSADSCEYEWYVIEYYCEWFQCKKFNKATRRAVPDAQFWIWNDININGFLPVTFNTNITRVVDIINYPPLIHVVSTRASYMSFNFKCITDVFKFLVAHESGKIDDTTIHFDYCRLTLVIYDDEDYGDIFIDCTIITGYEKDSDENLNEEDEEAELIEIMYHVFDFIPRKFPTIL